MFRVQALRPYFEYSNVFMLSSMTSQRGKQDIGLDLYALPQARTQGQIALFVWLLAMVLVIAFCWWCAWWFETLQILSGLVLVWWLASCVVVFKISPQNERNMLRARGSKYAINARNYPRLKTLLHRGSASVGVREPEGTIQESAHEQENSHENFEVRIAGSAPHFVVVGQGATRDYEPPELDCLVLRCLVHVRLGNVARLDAIGRLSQMTPLHRVLVWPVALYGAFLRVLWWPHAEASADRLALLLVKNPKLVMSALLKNFVASHTVLQARGVSFDDVDAHLKGGGLLEKSGEQMSAQYALGNALRDDAAFNARLNAITSWINSPEYVSALEQLAK